MIRLRPILKGEGRSLRVTFTNADTEQVIDTTGWTLKVRLGRSPHVLGDLYEVTGAPDAAQAALGQISCTIADTVTSALTVSSVALDILVDTGSGEFIPLMLAVAPVLDAELHRQNYYRQGSGPIVGETPVYVQGGSQEPDNITINVSNDMDPTFDLGVMVKFNQLDPATLEYLEALQADVTQKHTEVMGA